MLKPDHNSQHSDFTTTIIHVAVNESELSFTELIVSGLGHINGCAHDANATSARGMKTLVIFVVDELKKHRVRPGVLP